MVSYIARKNVRLPQEGDPAPMNIARTEDEAKAAYRTFSEEEKNAAAADMARGVDPVHAVNLVRSRRRQSAASGEHISGAGENAPAEAGPLEAASVAAGNTAMMGGLPSVLALAGSGEGETFAERRASNVAGLEEMNEQQPGAMLAGDLAGGVLPGASGLVRATRLGTNLAKPTIARATGVGAGMGALGGAASSETGEAGDVALRGLGGAAAGSVLGGGLAAAPGLALRLSPTLATPVSEAARHPIATAGGIAGDLGNAAGTLRLRLGDAARAATPQRALDAMDALRGIKSPEQVGASVVPDVPEAPPAAPLVGPSGSATAAPDGLNLDFGPTSAAAQPVDPAVHALKLRMAAAGEDFPGAAAFRPPEPAFTGTPAPDVVQNARVGIATAGAVPDVPSAAPIDSSWSPGAAVDRGVAAEVSRIESRGLPDARPEPSPFAAPSWSIDRQGLAAGVQRPPSPSGVTPSEGGRRLGFGLSPAERYEIGLTKTAPPPVGLSSPAEALPSAPPTSDTNAARPHLRLAEAVRAEAGPPRDLFDLPPLSTEMPSAPRSGRLPPPDEDPARFGDMLDEMRVPTDAPDMPAPVDPRAEGMRNDFLPEDHPDYIPQREYRPEGGKKAAQQAFMEAREAGRIPDESVAPSRSKTLTTDVRRQWAQSLDERGKKVPEWMRAPSSSVTPAIPPEWQASAEQLAASLRTMPPLQQEAALSAAVGSGMLTPEQAQALRGLLARTGTR